MTELISLYDYLSRAAGSKLGAEVAKYAKHENVRVGTRQVDNKAYSGPVNLYERSFLEAFFNNQSNQSLITEDKRLYTERMLKKHASKSNSELPF